MKTVRTISQSPVMALFLSFLIIFVSCNQDDFVNNQIENSLNSINGKNLFKGLIFNSGNVKNILPEVGDRAEIISNLDKDSKMVLSELENEVIEKISIDNPNYFNQFKSTILSKDHYSIKNELIEAANLTRTTSLSILGVEDGNKSYYEMVNQISNNKDFWNSDGTIDFEKVKNLESQYNLSKREGGKDVLLALVLVAVAVAVYAWVWFWPKNNSTNVEMNPQSLEMDNLVNSIVNHTN